MKSTEMEFTLGFRIQDENSFRKAASARAAKDGATEAEAKSYLKKKSKSLEDCAIMLLDPGSLDGCKVHQSSAETFPS